MKTQRQAKIMEIISTRDIETQEQLLQALQDEGFYSTQATISRDIKELRVVKELTSFGTYRYTASAKDGAGTFSARLNTIFRECITALIMPKISSSLKRCPAWPQRRPLRWMR